jgi:4-hydroxy-tetrahydrodipicolinate synthase
MLPETTAKLAKLKNIVGIKEASGDLEQIARTIELVGKDFSVISGDDSLTLEILKLGGVGVISVASNLVPGKVVKLVESFKSGDIETAKKIHDELSPLFKALFIETNPAPVKAAMNWLGMAAGGLRLPLVELEPENQKKLREVLVGMGLLK